VSLSFYRFDRWSTRLWALMMMGAARLPLSRMPGLEFWKLCGSGTGEGFTPRPNPAVCAILCAWRDEATARRALAEEPLFRRYRDRAAEHWTVFLGTTSVRGQWSGRTPFAAEAPPAPDGPLAALTRATVKPWVAPWFWRREPDVSRAIGADPSVLFKIGIGEVPLVQQITFSIWPDRASMARFARADGPHARAVAAVREGQWFREELYARFAILGDVGTWDGQSPLARIGRQT